jgi:2-oxoisovalerate dehydrogenase E1 component
VRIYSHSFSEDDKHYRLNAEREADAMRDPLHKLQMRLLREGILNTAELNALEQQIDEQVEAAAVRAVEAPTASGFEHLRHVYSEDFDPTRVKSWPRTRCGR